MFHTSELSSKIFKTMAITIAVLTALGVAIDVARRLLLSRRKKSLNSKYISYFHRAKAGFRRCDLSHQFAFR